MKRYFILKNYIDFIKNKLERKYNISYSQFGEDIIISYIFKELKIKKPTYLDIGANHPSNLSNTYLFYKNNSSGVCIEPDLELLQLIQKKRPRDTCLNYGVGFSSKEETADFYVMSAKTLSTFSKIDAEKYVQEGNYKIMEIKKIRLIPINNILTKYFKNNPNLISLDTEGLDLEILKSIDFNKFRPEVLCVETSTHSKNGEPQKLTEIINFVKEKDYFVYADTFTNTIFVEKKSWINRHK